MTNTVQRSSKPQLSSSPKLNELKATITQIKSSPTFLAHASNPSVQGLLQLIHNLVLQMEDLPEDGEQKEKEQEKNGKGVTRRDKEGESGSFNEQEEGESNSLIGASGKDYLFTNK